MPDNILIPYGRQYIDASDIEAVIDVLRSDWLTQGPRSSASSTRWLAIADQPMQSPCLMAQPPCTLPVSL